MMDNKGQAVPMQPPYPTQGDVHPPYPVQNPAPPGFAPQLLGPPASVVPMQPLAEGSPDMGIVPPQQPGGSSSYIGFAPSEAPPMVPPPYPGLHSLKYGKFMEDSPDHHAEDTEPVLKQQFGAFTEKAVRQAFVRKVYAILMIQLAITVGIVALFVFEPHMKAFVHDYPGTYVGAYFAFLIIYTVLVCAEGLRRSYPTNIILLFMFTLVMSYLVGTISSFHETNAVLMAGGICASCCLVVSLLSCYSKFDFTTCGGFLFVGLWVLIMFGIVSIFTYSRILSTVYAALGSLLFMAFLAFDTQRIMGGRKFELSPEEHIFASLQLYMDIVQLFLLILRLTGMRR